VNGNEEGSGMTGRLIIAVVLSIAVMIGINFLFPADEEEPATSDQIADGQLSLEASADSTAGDTVATEAAVPVAEAPAEGAEAIPVPVAAEATNLTTAKDGKTTPIPPPGTVAATVEAATPIADQYKGELLVTIETDMAIFRFSNIGGAIRSVTLKDHKDYDGTQLTLFNKLAGEYFPGMLTVDGVDPRMVYDSNLPSGHQTITGDEQLTLRYYTWVGAARVVKSYTLRGDSYLGYLDLDVSSSTVAAHRLDLQLGTGLDRQGEMREAIKDTLVTMAVVGDDEFEENPGSNDLEEMSGVIENVAICDQYFAFALKPTVGFTGRMALEPIAAEPQIANTVLNFSTDAAGNFNEHFLMYVGPKSYDSLDALGMANVVNLGWSFIAPLSIGALKLLNLFFSFLGNYGLAILLLTLVLKLALFPLTNRSFKSSMAMQRLAPRVEAIKQKYANDQQRANTEVMELYKKHKVSPLGGCLPLLLQMPVFISLFGALRNAVELRGAGFLWITDLTLPDALFSWGIDIPLIGSTFNLLPLFMIAAMWFQNKQMAKRGTQQAGFTKYLPFIFGVMFYQMPSGLVLYWVFNTVLTIGQQALIIRKQDEDQALVEAAIPRGKKGKKKALEPMEVVETQAVAEKPKPTHDVSCDKCNHKTTWSKTKRRSFINVNLRTGGNGDVQGVYCPKCGNALALAIDDDDRYVMAGGDWETPPPSKNDDSWGKILPPPNPGEGDYRKVK